ncbi:DUF4271 domain-containing protein [Riemerella columbina]|uniref:DUF4271 domain-containing protein n=1 Tax=Riemerella columbina TaxID=103810 RepID=UPI0003747184|nr:DUF4271 domain-containing protein [Riemerella columbina]
MVRIIENKDWVIYTLLAVGFLYVFIFRVLMREITLLKYLALDLEFVNNRFQTWLMVSAGFVVVAGLALAPFLPVIPEFYHQYDILGGYQLNKLGCVLVTLLGLFAFRILFTYFLLANSGELERWQHFYFVTTKIFLVYTLVLTCLVLIQYYIPIPKDWMIYTYLISFIIGFIFKNLIYIFKRPSILPEEWYYKILYICTLQILPFLVVCKLLFF